MNPTFSDRGGFRIRINGITIYQVEQTKSQYWSFQQKLAVWKGVCPQKYGTLESEWDSQKGLQPLTRKFQIFANKVTTNMTMIFFYQYFNNPTHKKCLLYDCNERNFD